MFVNCKPARRLCLPDLAPAQAIVRAGERTGRCGIVALARGWPCGSGGALCPCARLASRFCRGAFPRFTPGFAVLSRCCPRASGFAVLLRLCPRARSALRSCRSASPSVHACCLSCDKQDGLRYLAFLFRRVEIAIRVFSNRQYGYRILLVHFGRVRFFMAIPTGDEETRRTRGRGTESAANRECAFA